MNAKLILESGIKPWNSIKNIEDESFITLTVISTRKESLLSVLFSLFSIINSLYGVVFRWHTTLHSFTGNKIQAMKLKKELSENPKGFTETTTGQSQEGVWSNLSKLILPFSSGHFDYLADGERSCLLFCSESIDGRDELLDSVNLYANGFSAEKIDEFFSSFQGVIGRAYEDEDTHCVFQLIGRKQNMDTVQKNIEVIGLEYLNRAHVAAYINNSAS